MGEKGMRVVTKGLSDVWGAVRRSMKVDMPDIPPLPDFEAMLGKDDKDEAAGDASASTRSRYNRRRGRGATILTSGLGVSGPANVGLKKLTGG